MTTSTKERSHDIADIGLAERGRFRMQWAAKEMPVLDLIEPGRNVSIERV